MIICPTHRFAFVHVPKCAGTSVRLQIAACDPEAIAMGEVGVHPVLGRIDYGHVPLPLLRQHFPEEYDWLTRPDMDSFAILRDPLARFGSSLRQTLWRYGDRPMTLIPPDELRETTLRLLDEIAAEIDAPSHKFIFFARQRDFVFDGDRQVTRHLVPLELVDDFIAYLSRRTGVPMETGQRANQNVDLRFKRLGAVAMRANATLRKALPQGVHARVKDMGVKLLATKRSAAESSGILDLPEVRAFVAEHYAEDVALYGRVAAEADRLKAAFAAGDLAATAP